MPHPHNDKHRCPVCGCETKEEGKCLCCGGDTACQCQPEKHACGGPKK